MTSQNQYGMTTYNTIIVLKLKYNIIEIDLDWLNFRLQLNALYIILYYLSRINDYMYFFLHSVAKVLQLAENTEIYFSNRSN